MKKKPLSRPFVVTVSAFSIPTGIVACSREAPVTNATMTPATSATTSTPDASSTAAPSRETSAAKYPRTLNAVDTEGHTVFRAYEGQTERCYVELTWPKGGPPRRPGERPPSKPVTCPSDMQSAAWEACRGGTLQQETAGGDCTCFRMGNPPPPPQQTRCP